MDVSRLQDLIERLSVAAGLEADGVPLDEIAEHDDECAAFAAPFGSFEAAHAAAFEALRGERGAPLVPNRVSVSYPWRPQREHRARGRRGLRASRAS